jgi:hypothetical protein
MGLWIVKTLLNIDFGGEMEASIDLIIKKRVNRVGISDVSHSKIESFSRIEGRNITSRAVREIIKPSDSMSTVK